MFAAYACLPGLLWVGLPWTVPAAIALSAPLAVWQTLRLASGEWRQSSMLQSIPFWASTHNALAALLALIGTLAARSLAPLSLQIQLFPVYLYGTSFAYFWFKSTRAVQSD